MDRIWLQQQVASQIYKTLKLSIGQDSNTIKELVDGVAEDIIELVEGRTVIAKTSGEVITS